MPPETEVIPHLQNSGMQIKSQQQTTKHQIISKSKRNKSHHTFNENHLLLHLSSCTPDSCFSFDGKLKCLMLEKRNDFRENNYSTPTKSFPKNCARLARK